MKISDFDIYHLPPLMGMFVDYIENECERLLQESPQFTELQREDHELLDEYPFLNMITDSNGVTKALDLNSAETEALARFCLVEDDINCWKQMCIRDRSANSVDVTWSLNTDHMADSLPARASRSVVIQNHILRR